MISAGTATSTDTPGGICPLRKRTVSSTSGRSGSGSLRNSRSRENSSSERTMLRARSVCSPICPTSSPASSPLPVPISSARICADVEMFESGLFSSCATPESRVPSEASFSDWIRWRSCSSRSRSIRLSALVSETISRSREPIATGS